jgi:site-specific recombinase XerD
VAEALAEHLRAYPPTASGLIFHTSTGRPYGGAYAGEVFRRAVKRAGLGERTGTHALRHHFTCELLDQGVSVIEMADLLGHENATQVGGLSAADRRSCARTARVAPIADCRSASPAMHRVI